MLSRTADHLFWMSRYMERAENTARMLDVNYQTSLLPQSAAVAEQGWRPAQHQRADLRQRTKRYGEVNAARRDGLHGARRAQPSSIVSCLKAARENARAVRGTLTTEVWETTNQTWLESSACSRTALSSATRRRSCSSGSSSARTCRAASGGHHADGRGAALHAPRHLPGAGRQHRPAAGREVPCRESDFFGAASEKDQEYDFYHWSAILRSVSGFEIYRKVYRDVIKPERWPSC
jgi:uncharacterized alpha-E superfamily protein